MRLPAILDAVEAILGPDIMVWNSNLYPKEPGEDGHGAAESCRRRYASSICDYLYTIYQAASE